MAEKFAALSYFTNMTMRLRLDRVEGVGELVVAGPEVAEAAVNLAAERRQAGADRRESHVG